MPEKKKLLVGGVDRADLVIASSSLPDFAEEPSRKTAQNVLSRNFRYVFEESETVQAEKPSASEEIVRTRVRSGGNSVRERRYVGLRNRGRAKTSSAVLRQLRGFLSKCFGKSVIMPSPQSLLETSLKMLLRQKRVGFGPKPSGKNVRKKH